MLRGRPVLLLTQPKSLFDKRGSIYSSRPKSYIAHELLFPGQVHILLNEYGPEWRLMRKIAQSCLNHNSIQTIVPIQDTEATQTMFQIMRDPNKYHEYVRRYSAAVVLASVYGQRASDPRSTKIQRIYSIMERFLALMEPGATPPVDVMTILQYLPDSVCWWKREAKAIRRDELALYTDLINETREKIQRGECADCFLLGMFEDQKKHNINDEWFGYIAGLFVRNPLKFNRRIIGNVAIVDGSRLRHDIVQYPCLYAGHDCLSGRIQESTEGN